MPSILLEYRLRIRDAADTTDVLSVTSVRGDTAPYISEPPTGDGAEIDPLTGRSRQGAFTGRIVDSITSGTTRVFTSVTEDSSLRQQLAGRKGFWEYRTTVLGVTSGWSTLIAGLVTRYALVSAAEWEVVIGDPTQVEHGQTAFGPRASTTSSIQLESIANYLGRWSNRGCLFGGPIRGGFLPTLGVDKGGWIVTVDSVSSVSDTFLRVVSCYGAPQFDVLRGADQLVSQLAGAINQAAAPYFQQDKTGGFGLTVPSALTRVDEVMSLGSFPGIVVELRQLDNTLVGYYATSVGNDFGVGSTDLNARKKLISVDPRYPGFFLYTTSLTAGATQYRARAFTIQPTDISPIYWTGHPVDFLVTVWQSLGLSVDTSGTGSQKAKSDIGNDLRLSLRITSTEELGAFLEKAVYGPFGLSVRTDDTGRLVPIATRIVSSTPPSVTITAADIRDGQNPLVFELDDSTAVKTISLKHQRFVPLDQNDMNGLNGLTTTDELYERTNGDANAVGTQTVSYEIPGMAHLGDAVPNADALADWFNGVAREVFDRWGRGIITATIPALRGGSADGVRLGDLVTNTLPQFPNRNKRLLDDNTVPGRIMQVVRVTPAPVGAEIKLADAGPFAAAISTLPTLSIAASSDLPRNVAILTVTNAATLNAATLGIRLYMAVTTGGAPAAGDYASIASYDPGQVPTTAIRLPPVAAGRSVYVIARSESPPFQPSALTSAVNITLSTMAPVTSLVATPSGTDGSKCVLTWTPPASTQFSYPIVWIRLATQPANQAVNARGSDPLTFLSSQFTIDGLTPGVQYTAGVQEVDVWTGDTSAIVEVTFTAGATTFTLPVPVYPQGFWGNHPFI